MPTVIPEPTRPYICLTCEVSVGRLTAKQAAEQRAEGHALCAQTEPKSPTFAHTPRPHASPWGFPEDAGEIAAGIWNVSTPSHGGILISAERRAAMPTHLREFITFAGGNWYEEDCDWCVVALAFPEYFTAEVLDAARLTYKGWIENRDRFQDAHRLTAAGE